MKFTTDRPYSNPEAAARKLIEIAIRLSRRQSSKVPTDAKISQSG